MALSFLVTSRCTLRCKHCFYHKASGTADEELTFDEYERLSRSLDDFLVGLFCGGEPFMRRDLSEIVTMLRRNNDVPLAGAATNGQLTSSILRQTEAILEADPTKPFNLSFSLDGFRGIHDLVRGAGTFDRAVRTYREVKRLASRYPNLVLSTTTVVTTVNQRKVPSFLRWVARELSPAASSVLLVRQSPRAGDYLKQVEPACYREALNAALACTARGSVWGAHQPHVRFLSTVADAVHRTMESGERSFHCYAGVHGAVVDYKGDVSACEVLAEEHPCGIAGNLREHDMDFGALWNGASAARMRRLVNAHASCASCTHETMGLIPSLAFPPNRLGYVMGGRRPRPRRRRAADVAASILRSVCSLRVEEVVA
jgi:radical SAM protein with 4Fe4S-binding SPASM domain